MDNYVTRAEHKEFRCSIEEFNKRIDERDKRQDKRIELLEQNVEKFGALTLSVEKLAMNIEAMVKEQARQGERIEQLEQKPIKRMNAVGATVRTAVITALISCTVSALITWIVATV